jgi:hypothetical protein
MSTTIAQQQATLSNRSLERFWVVTALVALALGVYFSFFLTVDRLAVAEDGRVRVVDAFIEKIKQRRSDFDAAKDGELSAVQGALAALVNDRLDVAFQPVYDNIPTYLDFHYSVLGSYTEITAALSSELANVMIEHLFKGTDVDAALERLTQEVDETAKTRFAEAMAAIRGAAKEHLEFSSADLDLVEQIAPLTKPAINARLSNEINAVRGAGLVGGVVASRQFSKYAGRRLAKTFVGRLAAQGVRSAASKTTGGSAGAVTGAKVGLLCGPAAWICSPLLAVGGAAIGIVAAEALIVSLDEAINRESFEQELRRMLDQQKADIKAELLAPSQKFAELASSCIDEGNRKFLGPGVRVIDQVRGKPVIEPCSY